MVSLSQIIGFACMVTLSSSFSVETDCIAMRRHEAKLHGSHAHITAWLLDENDHLLLTLAYDKGFPYFYDYIEFKPKGLDMKRVRENEETIYKHINFTQPLDIGWVVFEFHAEKQYRFDFKSQDVYLSGESILSLTKFTVDGSNITINCNLDSIYWKIQNDVTYIPLKQNSTNSLSLFSRSDFQPTLTAGNSSIELGMIGNAINNIQPYKDGHQSPLPRFKEHIVKITCISYHYCQYILGVDENQKFQLIFSDRYTYLVIQGKGNEFFVKLDTIKPNEASQTNSTSILKSTQTRDNNKTSLIILSILLAIVVIAIPTTAFLIYYLTKKQHERQLDEMKPMMVDAPSTREDNHDQQHEKHIEKILRIMGPSPKWKGIQMLWDAVVHNNIQLVEDLLESGENPEERDEGLSTSPLEEAHLLGHKDIVKLFLANINSKQSVPMEKMEIPIKVTLEELENRMGQVFQAAKYGIYARDNGVNALLKTHSLPGTIKDSKGWSLIHYMATAKYSDDCPSWEPEDIKNFFKHHVFYINAIDHWGDTPLHFLAQHHGSKDTEHQGSKNVKWNGKNTSVEEAWLEMAELFIYYECDPRIPNHKNKLPHELATENGNDGLATYLKQKFESMKDIEHESAAGRFGELVEAARNNRFYKIIRLLKKHVPMLPISAERDPLVEAIRNGHAEVVFLLICAGTPLCNCSIDDLTPLEAAHNTLGLPALFPALMRKVYSDRLEAEKDRLKGVKPNEPDLVKGIESIKTSIVENGDKSNWVFESKEEHHDDRSKEARKLLLAASGHGLSLTVQLLGLEDVELRPLPDENSPVDKAHEGNHLDTLYVLCRDLKMAPYGTHKKSKTLKRLENDLLIAERNIFKNSAQESEEQLLLGLESDTIIKMLEEAKETKESEHDRSLCNTDIFYIFARYGLIYLLDKYKKMNEKFDLDQIVQNYSSSTMLHISILYGQQDITQYLLYHGASPKKKTIGGYTAAHIAAIVGHKDSMDYILSYKKSKSLNEDKCDLDMTAKELFDEYEVMRKGCNYPFLESRDARNVKNEIGESNMAFEILKRKSKVLKINDKDCLIKEVAKLICKTKDVENPQAEIIISETKAFFQGVTGDYKGNLKEFGQYFEDNSLFHNDIVEFILELDLGSYSAHADTKNTILEVRSVEVEDNIKVLKINKECKGNINHNNIFMKDFIKDIKERIKKYEPLNKKVSLCPPFLIPLVSGVELCWALNSENKLYRIKSYVDLVIKADLPETNVIKRLPENIQKLCESISAELHVTDLNGDWTYRGYSLENKIFKNLNENQRMVWLICRFIKLISKQYWWVPTSNIRKIVHRLDENFAGVTFPPERALKALFLNELADNPDHWEKDDIFDRVIGIYNRCMTTDYKGNKQLVVSVKSFMMPTSYIHKLTDSVHGVIRYLEGLK